MDRRRAFLLLLVVSLLATSVAFVMPFLDYFLLAVILAYVLWPVQRRLATRVGETVAAGTIVLGAGVTIVGPTLFVVWRSYTEGRALLEEIRAGEFTFAGLEASIRDVAGVQLDISAGLQDLLRNGGVSALGDLVSLVWTVTHVVIGVGLTLFLLFYFLRDGDDFLVWLRDVVPLSPAVLDELTAEIDSITGAVLAGHVFVAIVQGVLAGAGLWVTGVPNATFWTVVMVVLALLPIIGSFMVWGPAVVWLLFTGEPVAAGLLLFYGTVVVGVSDDYLRPIVVDRYAHLNPAVIIIGVLGGIYVIGFMGIFVGPIVIGSLRAVLDVYDREVVETGDP